MYFIADYRVCSTNVGKDIFVEQCNELSVTITGIWISKITFIITDVGYYFWKHPKLLEVRALQSVQGVISIISCDEDEFLALTDAGIVYNFDLNSDEPIEIDLPERILHISMDGIHGESGTFYVRNLTGWCAKDFHLTTITLRKIVWNNFNKYNNDMMRFIDHDGSLWIKSNTNRQKIDSQRLDGDEDWKILLYNVHDAVPMIFEDLVLIDDGRLYVVRYYDQDCLFTKLSKPIIRIVTTEHPIISITGDQCILDKVGNIYKYINFDLELLGNYSNSEIILSNTTPVISSNTKSARNI